MSRSNQPETVQIPINNFIFSDDLTNHVDDSKENSTNNNEDLVINPVNQDILPPEKPKIHYSLLYSTLDYYIFVTFFKSEEISDNRINIHGRFMTNTWKNFSG